MASFLGNMVKGNTDINDEVIVNTLMGSAAAAASAYLTAALTTATPELRAMYSASVNTMIAKNTAIGDLAVTKGWEKPYNTPSQKLTDAYNKSKSVVDSREM